jgi:hypothetical protein
MGKAQCGIGKGGMGNKIMAQSADPSIKPKTNCSSTSAGTNLKFVGGERFLNSEGIIPILIIRLIQITENLP